MDSFEWNKIFGAVLAALFVVLGINFLAEGIFSSHAPEKAGFEIAGGEVQTEGGPKKAAGPESINALLASADLAQGEKVAKKCVACHTFQLKPAQTMPGVDLTEMSERLSPEVEARLDDMVERCVERLRGWGHLASPRPTRSPPPTEPGPGGRRPLPW